MKASKIKASSKIGENFPSNSSSRIPLAHNNVNGSEIDHDESSTSAIIDTTKPSLGEPWTEKFSILNYASLSLENKGSVARDHLANERTFLAWLRTSLSFITIGIGVTQLFRLESKSTSVDVGGVSILLTDDTERNTIEILGKPLGIIFILLGICSLLFGSYRFFQVQSMLTKNLYPAARVSLFSLILVLSMVIILTLVMSVGALD